MIDRKEFVLYRNTKDRCDNEHEDDVIDQMDDDKDAIDYPEFAANCEHVEIAAQLGYDDELAIEDDWSVTFQKSKYGGLDCFMLEHTECDFIFLRPEDAKMLQEAFAKGTSPLEWKRHTQFGKNATDPR